MQEREDREETVQQAYDNGQYWYQRAQEIADHRNKARQNDLKTALSHYEVALRLMPAQHPEPHLWAKLQHALGDTYRAGPGSDRVKDLRKATECYQNCLQVLIYDHWYQVQEALVTTSSTLTQELIDQVTHPAGASGLPFSFTAQHAWERRRFRSLLLLLFLVMLILAVLLLLSY